MSDLIEQVRAALKPWEKPWDNQRLIHRVQMGSSAVYGTRSNPGDVPKVTVLMNIDEHEIDSFQDEAERLVREAGLRVQVLVQRNRLSPPA